MVKQVSEETLSEIQASERHDEMMSCLKAMLRSFNSDKEEKTIAAIERQTAAMNLMAATIKSLPAPKVNIENKYNEVVSSIQSLAENMIKELRELKEAIAKKPNHWEFTVKKNYDGFLEKLIAEAKYKT